MFRTSWLLALSAITLSCGGSTHGPDPQPPGGSPVEISIAAVTLAQDCGTGPTAAVSEREAPESRSTNDGEDDAQRRMCQQTSVQLRLANHTAAASTIAMRKVELLDDHGALLGELQPRAPSRWNEGVYQPWDEQLAPDQTLEVSYALSALPVLPGATYTLRITVSAAGADRTLEQITTIEDDASEPALIET